MSDFFGMYRQGSMATEQPMTEHESKEDKEQPMPGSLRLWTITEVAEATNISVRTLRAMVKQGDLAVKRIGTGRKSIRIPNDEVVRLARA